MNLFLHRLLPGILISSFPFLSITTISPTVFVGQSMFFSLSYITNLLIPIILGGLTGLLFFGYKSKKKSFLLGLLFASIVYTTQFLIIIFLIRYSYPDLAFITGIVFFMGITGSLFLPNESKMKSKLQNNIIFGSLLLLILFSIPLTKEFNNGRVFKNSCESIRGKTFSAEVIQTLNGYTMDYRNGLKQPFTLHKVEDKYLNTIPQPLPVYQKNSVYSSGWSCQIYRDSNKITNTKAVYYSD